jgi:hypothetical protein
MAGQKPSYEIPDGQIWFRFDGDVVTYETGAFKEEKHNNALDALSNIEKELGTIISRNKRPNAKPRKAILASWQNVGY